MEAPADLSRAVELWARVGLSAERHEALDAQALSIADNQQDSAVGREALKEVQRCPSCKSPAGTAGARGCPFRRPACVRCAQVIRDFKGTPPEERLRRVGPVIKAFQSEVDALTCVNRLPAPPLLMLLRGKPRDAAGLIVADAPFMQPRASGPRDA
jgi:homeobox protein cut-like